MAHIALAQIATMDDVNVMVHIANSYTGYHGMDVMVTITPMFLAIMGLHIHMVDMHKHHLQVKENKLFYNKKSHHYHIFYL
jgi:hypothetical protein